MPANPSSPIIRFSTFEVNFQTGELRQRGQKVKLQEQPLKILAALLERPGEMVTREELRSKLWPTDTFVDFDHSLNAAIKRLRDALGESADAPVFIETMARRGYRFIAPVDVCPAPGRIGVAAATERSKSSFVRPRVAIALLSPIVIALLSAPAISPDGRYLAYADNTGIYLKVIRTGEIHPVALPPNFSAGVDDWFPDGSHLLVSRAEQLGKTSLWRISVFGGTPGQLASDASGGSVSPDGRHIAFRRGELTFDGLWGREEWVMRSDGTDQVKVATGRSDLSQLGAPSWSPDGKRIAYIRSKWSYNARTSSVEVNEWERASVETLFSDSRLGPALHWLPDDRLIFAFGSAQQQQDSSLWVVSLQQSRQISSPPKRITGGHGWISQVAGSAKAVIFLSGNWLASTYIGTLAADGTHLLAHRRLTLDENENVPSSWTPDGKAVLFSSDRNGTREIFKQAIDQPVAESLVTSADQVAQPTLTPDGSEVLYISTPKSPGPETPSSILAIPISGGTSRFVLKDAGIYNVQCARLPSTLCLYSIAKGNIWQTFEFDVRSGKRINPPQIDPKCNWSLSPDGSQRAIVPFSPDQGTIQLRSTSTGKTRDLVVKGWNGLMGIEWSADGRSLLVSWKNHKWDSALLNITLDGRASVLMRSSSSDIWHAVPSPDGRLLAIGEARGPQNVWQIENF
jgi:DNA-binding winged helix-turn-helix (wHTH) protein/Tol biopolymer transport system component